MIFVLIAILLLLVLPLLLLVGFAFRVTRQARKLAPPLGTFATVEGVRLHYVDRGTGQPIVLIHGLGSQLQNFTYALMDKLPGYRLIAIDRPGSGYSEAARNADLPTQARLVDGLLAQLGLDHVLITGHSLGGALTLVLASLYPTRASALALIAPLTQPQTELPGAFRRLAIRSDWLRWLAAWTIAVPLAIRGRHQALGMIFGPDRVPEDYGTRGGGILAIRPSAFRSASRDLVEVGLNFADLHARFHKISVPVGVLYGTGDLLLDYRLHGEGLRRQLPDVELELVEGRGHMLPLVDPERTASFIRRMAARASSAKADKRQATQVAPTS